MFIGRERELDRLEKMYRSDKFECAIIYGRRRVGKTTLINEFSKGKKTIFYVGLESNVNANLEGFSKAIFSYTMPEATIYPIFKSFDESFEYIATTIKDERLILVIDEYPYIAGSDKSLSSVLQKHIDYTFKNTKLFIILCGSSMSFMEYQVLGYKSPLYGRRTAQFKILPFTYYESAGFNPHYKNEDNAMVYGMTGGVPLYIEKVSSNTSIEQNIKDNFLDKNSFLFEEPSNLLKQELREPQTYNAIITAVANGASRLNEIATKTGLETGVCSKYLSVLISLGIIKKDTPVTEKSAKKTIYLIGDKLFNFWYRFVPGNMASIMSGRIESAYNKGIKPYLSEYMGRVFEDMCKDYLLFWCKDLPIDIGAIGQWWGNDPVEKRQVQIDIVVASSDGKSAIFGECRYKNDLMDNSVLDELIYESKLIGGLEDRYYYLFSKTGFTDRLKARAVENGVKLVVLDDLYNPQTRGQGLVWSE